MQVIRINDNNYDKIVKHEPVTTIAGFYKDSLLNDVRGKDWYYVAGTGHSRREDVNWSLVPGETFRDDFEFDIDKAETDFVEVRPKKKEEVPA